MRGGQKAGQRHPWCNACRFKKFFRGAGALMPSGKRRTETQRPSAFLSRGKQGFSAVLMVAE